jgi:hypothetical protein
VRSGWIGFLGLGGSTPVLGTAPTRGDGCAAFYPVAPSGWICLDAKTTLDPLDPEYAALRDLAPRVGSAWPYDYGESRETPRYYRVPTRAEQRGREPLLARHLEAVRAMHDTAADLSRLPLLLRGVDPAPAGQGPPASLSLLPHLHEYRDYAKAGSTISWSSSFDAEGRTWLVTGDVALVPKDKVAPFPRSTFHGVRLDTGASLPIAFVRGKPRAQHERRADGSFAPNGAEWPRFASLGLTGRREAAAGGTYLETTDAGRWIEQRDATVVRAAARTPWGARIDGAGAGGAAGGGGGRSPPRESRGTWVEVSVHGGWLLAYEGTRPVLATLVSTGRGETVGSGPDAFVQSATPDGVFAIQGKYLTSTMAVTDIVHFDVAFALPFHGAYALHAGHWAERWGEKSSMGCVNLAPLDARWLFDWSEPAMPSGWHGMVVGADAGWATIVVVHA